MAAAAMMAAAVFAQSRAKSAAANPVKPPRMTLSDVVRLARAGVSQDVILAQIRSKHAYFDLTADQLVELKTASVSERVIRVMLATAPPATPASKVAKAVTAQPAAAVGVAARAPAAAAAPLTWVTHKDPAGFAVDIPAGWNLQTDHQQGRIAIQGSEGQQAVIWPMFVEGQKLDTPSAGVLLRQLAQRADSGAAWGDAQPAGETARIFSRGQRSGTALMRWRSAPDGTSIFLFCVTASSSNYPASLDAFAGIIKSFHVLPAPAAASNAPPAPAARAGSPVAWVRWTDSREGAFGASVPRGWNVSGGAFRQSATDVRKSLVALSPDGQIRITVGDANIGAFALPSALYARAGMREGGYMSVGDGTRLQIRGFMPAQQFVQEYVTRTVARECASPRITSGGERQDLAAAATQRARAQGGQSARVTAGGVAFACTWNGREARGYYAAATVMVTSRVGGIWYVDDLYGYVAAADRQSEADSISRHVWSSTEVNAQWQQEENSIAGNAVAEDTRRSEEFQARSRQQIAEEQQKTSDMMMKGYQAQSQAYDEIQRRRENAILGKVDVVDPSSGKQYKIDNYSDYHWMGNNETIVGTKTDTSPGYDFRQMITLP